MISVPPRRRRVVLFVINEAFFFLSHRARLASLATEKGYEVHVAAPSHHTWAPPGFRVEALQRELGVVVHTFPLSRRGQNPFEEIATFAAMLTLFYRLKPDLVHLITIKPVLYGSIAARLVSSGIGVVVSIAGLGVVFSSKGFRARLRRWLVSGLLRAGLQRPHCITVVQNQGDLALLVEDGIVSREDLRLIAGSGVDLDTFRPVPEPAAERTTVMFASRLLWDKGVGEFCEVARRIHQDSSISANFVLVGDTHAGMPGAVPPTVIDEWVRAGFISWLGRREDMHDVIASANLVCLPTRYGEGVPKVLIEAAAVGRAIVATDIPGCREVVKNGENGILVAPNDIDGLEAAIRTLVQDPAKRREMGVAGARLASVAFDAESVAEKTVALYDLVCQDSRL